MIEESIIKSNFIGRDGDVWWIGQVAPEKAQGAQINGSGWGNRRKVRIMGYHPQNTVELPDEDLPWATVLLPTTAGSGKGNKATTISISPGDNVMGFFADGDDAQQPVITGVFGNTLYSPNGEYERPFQPFTGYTSKIKNDGSIVIADETNEENALSQKSPRHVSTDIANKISSETERVASVAEGKTVVFGSSSPTSKISKITSEVEGLVSDIKAIRNPLGEISDKIPLSKEVGSIKGLIDSKIDGVTSKITGLSNGLIGDMTGALYKDGMAPALNGGLKTLYNGVFATTFAATKSRARAKQAGAAAQAAMLLPVQAIQQFLPCAVQNVANSIGDSIKALLKGLIDNVTNFVSCIGEQFVAGIMNKIIGGLTNVLGPLMGGVSNILGGFSLGGFLRSKAAGLIAIEKALKCRPTFNYDASSNEWVIGKGPKSAVGVSVDAIMEAANAADALTKGLVDKIQDLSIAGGSLGMFDFLNPSVSAPGFSSGLGKCYAGPPLNCAGIKVNIFGTNGKGGIGKAIVGAIVGQGNLATGSIIGVDLVSGGSGYNAAPFIEITDECSNGYGAIAKAVVDFDEDSPTYQQIIDIYIVSEGENYPVPETETGEDIDYVPGPVVILDPGVKYDPDDKVTDNDGNEYTTYIDDNGRIINVIPPDSSTTNIKRVENLPELIISTKTGRGAILKPTLRRRDTYQGEIKQVIDCVS